MTSYDPAQDGAQMSFDGRMSYGDYLHIDRLLTSQRLLTGAHDEMLFIIQHQTSELWMKLALHELDAARRAIADGRASEAFKMLARISRIFEQLNNAWDVLRTMTPSDYTTFREGLGQSSGFQSWQYRLIEFAVGNRNLAMLRPHTHRADIMAMLENELARPSLYDEALRHLARAGLPIPDEVLNRDVSRHVIHTPPPVGKHRRGPKNRPASRNSSVRRRITTRGEGSAPSRRARPTPAASPAPGSESGAPALC